PADDLAASDDALSSGGSALSTWDALTSYAAARDAAATVITKPHPVGLHADRTQQPDNMHTQPQPIRPTYKWIWTFSGTEGLATVVVGHYRKPVATRSTTAANSIVGNPNGGL